MSLWEKGVEVTYAEKTSALETLAMYNGEGGGEVHVAYRGRIHDVSYGAFWLNSAISGSTEQRQI